MWPRHPIKHDYFGCVGEWLYTSTSSYMTKTFNAFARSPDSHAAMQRFVIESITLRDVQHQRLYVTVLDTKHSPKTAQAQLCIKATASDEYVPEYFFEHPDSHKVLDAILSAVEDLEVISPLASSSRTPSTCCDSDWPPSESCASQLTLVDPVPQTSTLKFYRSVTSVTGHRNKKNRGHGRVIRQINPKGLNLFELALLADVVHKQDRLYSLFHNQSYWYANLICNAIVALYGCKEQDTRGVAYYLDEVFIPPNDRLPKLAGQRKHIPIGNVEAVVLPVVLARFKQVRKERMDSSSNAVPIKTNEEAQKRAYNAKHLQDLQKQLSELEEIEETCIRGIAMEPKLPDAVERQYQIELTQQQTRRLYA